MSNEMSSIPFLMNKATRLLTRRAERSLKGLGMTASQIPVLHALKEGAAMYQRDLAALVEVEQPAMAELLGRMERDKLIRRTTDPEDRRSSRVELSDAAKRKIGPARAALLAGHQAALCGFSDHETRQLERLLGRIVRNLEEEQV
jgi:MarR family transcriptional regulator for hemolysin